MGASICCAVAEADTQFTICDLSTKNSNLAAEALRPLWDRFDKASDEIQGDILYVFGEIGDPRWVSWLESLLSCDFERELKEAAKKALEKISNTDT